MDNTKLMERVISLRRDVEQIKKVQQGEYAFVDITVTEYDWRFFQSSKRKISVPAAVIAPARKHLEAELAHAERQLKEAL